MAVFEIEMTIYKGGGQNQKFPYRLKRDRGTFY